MPAGVFESAGNGPVDDVVIDGNLQPADDRRIDDRVDVDSLAVLGGQRSREAVALIVAERIGATDFGQGALTTRGHFVGDPQVYRDRDEARTLAETRDPITLLRAKLDVSDDDFAEVDAEVTEIVEAALEFAKNGTDPAPEDALKNIYA